MSSAMQARNGNGGRSPASGPVCPLCAASIPADAKWCPSCRFTGGDTMEMFPDPPPPLLPLLDAAALWSPEETRKIEAAVEKIRRIYPQIRFHVFTVVLPPGTNLPTFGFWLLNAAPLAADESPQDRSWSVLLLIDACSGKAAVVPGYSAEHWIDHDEWTRILAAMAPAWKSGRSAKAVQRFFHACEASLGRAWKLRVSRRMTRIQS